MGLIRRLFKPEERADYTAQLAALLGGVPSFAGPAVSEESSLRSSAVFACVDIISGSLATLPLTLYRKAGRSKEPAINHPLYSILHDLANREITSAEWRQTAFAHVLLWGNHWSEIEYDDMGRIVGLWPLVPRHIEGYERREDGLYWLYRLPNGALHRFAPFQVHRIRGLGLDGIFGLSPIAVAARQAVGLSLATEEYGSRFFSNGARPGVLLRHPGQLSEQAHERLRKAFEGDHGGLSNAHRIKILEEGMDIATVGMAPEEAQFLETRKFQVTDIARIFRVPPHMLADLERATFSNIEHQGISFVVNTLSPWIVRHEQAILRDLLTPAERSRFAVKYNVNGLLRGDIVARYQAYATGIQNGFLTRNEAREFEDWNPIDGLDEPLVPLNMMEAGAPDAEALRSVGHCTCGHGDHPPVEQRADDDGDDPAPRIRDGRQAMIRRNVRLFEDAAGRLVRREISDLQRAIPKYLSTKRSITEFVDWLTKFYANLRGVVPGHFLSLMLTYAEQVAAAVADELGTDDPGLTDELREFVTQYLDNFAGLYVASSERQIRALLAEAEDEETARALIEKRLEEWQETRAAKFGMYQAFEAANALAIVVYSGAGVQFLRWAARGDSCPYCRSIDGKRIPIKGGAFVEAGGSVHGGEGEQPMTVKRTTRHGPLHGGCDCVVIAG